MTKADIVEGNGGLLKVQVASPKVIGEMYLHGAHVTSWTPAGAEEVLFVSRESRWEHGRAIRGGVPICFPWFGSHADNPQAPAHGFVRTKAWHLESIVQTDDAVTVSMFTESDDETKRWWPADFRLLHRATFGATLSLELVVTNTGTISMRFEEALHSYHHIGNISDIRVQGLDGIDYLDKTDGSRQKTQAGNIAIAAETDRIYLNTTGAIDVADAVLQRRIQVEKAHSRTTVVWNPWTAKARALPDLADDEWMRLICIETCNVGAYAVDLAPGEQHTMSAQVSLAPL